MMLGVDIVPIERLRVVLARSEGMEARLFTDRERAYCDDHPDRVRHLAGTLAAKEAVIKACRLGALAAFARRIEIVRDEDGTPNATVIGSPQHRPTLSISHDGGVAVAVAISNSEEAVNGRSQGVDARSPGTVAVPPDAVKGHEPLRANARLARYIKGEVRSVRPMDPRALVEAGRLTHGTDFP